LAITSIYCYVCSILINKTDIMTTTKTLYKGQTYTVTMRGNDFAYAIDANGYYVTDLKTIQSLIIN